MTRAWAFFGGTREIASSAAKRVRVFFIKIYSTLFLRLGVQEKESELLTRSRLWELLSFEACASGSRSGGQALLAVGKLYSLW